MKKKKRKLKKKVYFILYLILIIIGIFLFYLINLGPVSNESKTVEFEVKEGDTLSNLSVRLKKEGIIRSELAYKIYIKFHKFNELKKGVYILDLNNSTSEIINILTNKPNSLGVKITFKEGKNFRNIAKTISENTNITEEEVYNKLKDIKYVNSLIDSYWFLTDDINNKDIYYSLEGYLYPETYFFEPNDKIEDIFKKMLDQTDKIFSKYKSDFNKSDLSINEVVTLASMIEQEGKSNSDRKGISGVFYNRLDRNMSLGSDVTTYYAFKVDMGTRSLTSKEYNTSNSYNTRGPNMAGKLPVGAISNFSESSLEAALNPTSHNYLYFVSDKYGKTYFAKTDKDNLKKKKELIKQGICVE